MQHREELLHKPFFMGLESYEFLDLGGDEFVEGSEAVGDFLLFLLGTWNYTMH